MPVQTTERPCLGLELLLLDQLGSRLCRPLPPLFRGVCYGPLRDDFHLRLSRDGKIIAGASWMAK